LAIMSLRAALDHGDWERANTCGDPRWGVQLVVKCRYLGTGALQPGLQFSAQVLEVAGAAARQLLAGVVEEDP
jgi:hypothetical protein